MLYSIFLSTARDPIPINAHSCTALPDEHGCLSLKLFDDKEALIGCFEGPYVIGFVRHAPDRKEK